MENDQIIERLIRLENTVNSIASKIDLVLTPNTPTRRVSDSFFNEDSLRSGNWVRMYSKKKGENFLYHAKTQKIIWESEELAASTKNWEKLSFCDNKGDLQNFYLNIDSGEATVREPPNIADEGISLEFNPGFFDGNTKSGSNNGNNTPTGSRKSFVKPSQQTLKRKSRSVMIHPETDEQIITESPYQSTKHACMFDPFSSHRTAWDLCFILPCLLYLTVMMPYRLCFVDVARGKMLVMETTMDMFFVVDILINFRTGYFVPEEGIVEYDPKKVAKEYVRTWFALDLISGIPFGLFDMAFFNSLSFIKILKGSRMFKAVKLLRFFKLTRLFKLGKVVAGCSPGNMDWLEDKLNDVTTRSALSMMKIMAMISLVVHFMACLWVLIGRTEDIHNRPNWLNNDVYTGDGEGFTHQDTMGGPKVRAIYVSAYYYCYTTITSVGYGDIHPYNDNERLFCLALEALGGFMYAIIIAALTSIATITDTNKRAVGERLDMVASYVKIKRFPDQLGRRVRRYFRHFFETKTAIDEERILTDLPTGLRDEVSTFLVSDLMSNVTLFKDLGPVSWSRILPLLRPCRFEAGDLICSQGDPCTESFILLEGSCRAVTVVDPSLFSETMMLGGHVSNRASPPGVSTPAMIKSTLLSSTTPPTSFNSPPPSSTTTSSPVTTTPVTSIMSPSHAKEYAKSLLHSTTNSRNNCMSSRNDVLDKKNEPRGGLASPSSSMSFNEASPSKTTDDDSLNFPTGLKTPPIGERVSVGKVPNNPNNNHYRDLQPGSMVNVLCLLQIWSTCLETVMCLGETETYAINAKDFLTIFQQNDSHFKEITEKCVLTSFHMYKTKSKAEDNRLMSEYGIPLYMYNEAEIDFRTDAYNKWKEAKREKFIQALKEYEADVAKANALNRANALRTVVKMIRSRRDSRAIVRSKTGRRTLFDRSFNVGSSIDESKEELLGDDQDDQDKDGQDNNGMTSFSFSSNGGSGGGGGSSGDGDGSNHSHSPPNHGNSNILMYDIRNDKQKDVHKTKINTKESVPFRSLKGKDLEVKIESSIEEEDIKEEDIKSYDGGDYSDHRAGGSPLNLSSDIKEIKEDDNDVNNEQFHKPLPSPSNSSNPNPRRITLPTLEIGE